MQAKSAPATGLATTLGSQQRNQPTMHSRGASKDMPFSDAKSTQDADEEEEFFDDQWEDDDAIFETMDDTPCKIQPGLLISGFLAEQNKDKLQKAGVTHVLQVAEGLSPSHPSDFEYLNVSVLDAPGEDLVAHFQRAFAFINQAMEQQGAVLVHCVAGVSRSATVCIGYLMWQHKISYDEAFRRVHAVRPWIMPNAGFRHQLLRFQELGCDPSAWRAWRHSQPEEPAAVVSLASLGRSIPNGSSRSREQSSSSRSTYIPELGTSF